MLPNAHVQSVLPWGAFLCSVLTRKTSGFVTLHDFLIIWPDFVIAKSASVIHDIGSCGRKEKRGAVQKWI